MEDELEQARQELLDSLVDYGAVALNKLIAMMDDPNVSPDTRMNIAIYILEKSTHG